MPYKVNEFELQKVWLTFKTQLFLFSQRAIFFNPQKEKCLSPENIRVCRNNAYVRLNMQRWVSVTGNNFWILSFMCESTTTLARKTSALAGRTY